MAPDGPDFKAYILKYEYEHYFLSKKVIFVHISNCMMRFSWK